VAATMTAGYQKVFSANPALGFLAHARLLANSTNPNATRMIFNDHVNAALALFFMTIVVVVILACAREWIVVASGRKPPVVHEAPYIEVVALRQAAGGEPVARLKARLKAASES
jgi:carbon starvation protein